MTSRIDGTKVWVVGASSGIGAALAEELVRRGATLPMAILMKTARLLPVRVWASVSRRLAGG